MTAPAAAGTAAPGVDQGAVTAALAGARAVPFWLDTPLRPPPRPALDGDELVDLAVVGGGLTGLWAALLAAGAGHSVALLEAGRLGWAASGRNGGFCSASLTHGLAHGMARWPREMPTLQRLGAENLDAIEATVREHRIDCDFRRSGEMDVAVAPWQVPELAEEHRQDRRLGGTGVLLDAAGTRARVRSPTYLAGRYDPSGTALVDPARLLWGLADAAAAAGARIREGSRVLAVADEGDRVRLRTPSGTVRARRVVLATNAFGSPLRRDRAFVVPVWDHVLVTEPLTGGQLASIGWSGREGLSDAGNRFHYYRLTPDDRILWGGYDAVYYYGGDVSPRRGRRPATERLLAGNLMRTFPQLTGLRVSHLWAGAIDTCSRFTAFWSASMGAKAVSVAGYTGLGVGASRFGALVALDLLHRRDTERTRLEMVRRRPVPFPPEPLRWAGIQLTRRSLARADENQGRRDMWLRALDRLGLGFDS